MKTAINLIGFGLVAAGAYQGIEAVLQFVPTAEPLAFATAGAFILMITNMTTN